MEDVQVTRQEIIVFMELILINILIFIYKKIQRKLIHLLNLKVSFTSPFPYF